MKLSPAVVFVLLVPLVGPDVDAIHDEASAADAGAAAVAPSRERQKGVESAVVDGM